MPLTRNAVFALGLAIAIIFSSTSPALATINNGEIAIDILGQFAGPQGSDTSPVYTQACLNDGPSPYSLANNVNIASQPPPVKVVIDPVNHWLFASDSGNRRVLVYPLNGSTNLLSSKTPTYVLVQNNFTDCQDNGYLYFAPSGLAIDPTNHLLYVADGYGSVVFVFNTASMSNGELPTYELGASTCCGQANGGTTAANFGQTTGLALDVTDQLLYMSDSNNNRVLAFNVAPGTLSNGESATYVLGQTSMTVGSTNQGGSSPSQSSLNDPVGLAYDSTNQLLYVVDQGNYRVMVFPAYGNTSWTGSGENASYVLGTSSFTTAGGGTTPSTFINAHDVVVDSADSLIYVSDTGNNRILAFSTSNFSTLTGENASFVLGEPNFYTGHNLGNNGGFYSSQSEMDGPSGLAFDSTNKLLYENDYTDSRIMIFNTSSMTAGQVSVVARSDPDACAVTINGALYCWGWNVDGEDGLGGTSGYVEAPQQVGTATNWTTVSQGGYDNAACGIAGGKLYCWGHNAYGELGLGNTTQYTTPQQVGSATNWSLISQGGYDACGIAGGALYCWGLNAYGEVGNGGTAGFKTNTVFVTSTTYTGSISGANGIAGANTACSTRATASGSLAPSGTYLAWLTTTTALAPSGISTFTSNTFPYVDVNGNVLASNWTNLISGTLGYGIQYSELGGTALSGSAWTDVATSGAASTSSASSTTKNCAGWTNATASDKGDVGTLGSTSSTWTAAATTITCSTAEHLYCFEQNNGTNQVNSPVQIGTDTTWTAVSQSGTDACGIDNGKLYCWGQNAFGELGLGNTTEYTTPQQVGTATNWTVISQGSADTCGIAGGKLYCWGQNHQGEFGLGNTTQYTTPQQVGTATNWTAISVVDLSGGGGPDPEACGIAGGALFCAGQNGYGESGVGNTTQSPTFQQAGSATNWTAIAYAGDSTCGVAGGQLYCWGQNAFGSDGLGNASTSYSTPQAVTLFDVNVENATDEIGQYTSQTSAATVNWTQNAPNNGANGVGFWGTPPGVALDSTNHYLYVTDGVNNRVMVYALNTDNSIPTGSGGHTASYVLGTSGYPTNLIWDGYGSECTASNVSSPSSVVFDAVNSRLFVSDAADDRVLVFNTSTVSNNMAASYVIGETSLTSCTFNGTASQSQMYRPAAMVYDAVNSRLFVSDNNSSRVLVFNVAPGAIANGENATYVLGQTNFTNTTTGTTSTTMNGAVGLAYDPVNTRLFVSDQGNNRVLVFNVPTGTNLTNKAASYVLGQTTFTTGSANGGASNDTQSGLNRPFSLAYDATAMRLFVSDQYNDRVLVFNVGPSVIKNGENASFELGTTAFVANTYCGGNYFVSCIDYAAPSQAEFVPNGALFFDPGSQRLFLGDTNRVLIFDVTPMNTNMEQFIIPGYD